MRFLCCTGIVESGLVAETQVSLISSSDGCDVWARIFNVCRLDRPAGKKDPAKIVSIDLQPMVSASSSLYHRHYLNAELPWGTMHLRRL